MNRKIKFKRIQCLDRALDIVSLLSESHGLSMNEIARQLDLKVPTAYNIVQTLASRGFLSNTDGKFEIGPSLGLAASRWDIEKSLPRLVEPILLEIQEKTGERCCVAIPVNGHQVELITPQRHNPDVSTLFTHTTWKYPLYLASGRVLAAFSSEKEWEEIIKEQLANGPTAEVEKDWNYSDWLNELLTVRENGFAVIAPRRPKDGGVSAVAVPLHNPAGEVVAAIGVDTIGKRATKKHLLFMKNAAMVAVSAHPLRPIRSGEVDSSPMP